MKPGRCRTWGKKEFAVKNLRFLKGGDPRNRNKRSEAYVVWGRVILLSDQNQGSWETQFRCFPIMLWRHLSVFFLNIFIVSSVPHKPLPVLLAHEPSPWLSLSYFPVHPAVVLHSFCLLRVCPCLRVYKQNTRLCIWIYAYPCKWWKSTPSTHWITVLR